MGLTNKQYFHKKTHATYTLSDVNAWLLNIFEEVSDIIEQVQGIFKELTDIIAKVTGIIAKTP